MTNLIPIVSPLSEPDRLLIAQDAAERACRAPGYPYDEHLAIPHEIT